MTQWCSNDLECVLLKYNKLDNITIPNHERTIQGPDEKQKLFPNGHRDKNQACAMNKAFEV